MCLTEKWSMFTKNHTSQWHSLIPVIDHESSLFARCQFFLFFLYMSTFFVVVFLPFWFVCVLFSTGTYMCRLVSWLVVFRLSFVYLFIFAIACLRNTYIVLVFSSINYFVFYKSCSLHCILLVRIMLQYYICSYS